MAANPGDPAPSAARGPAVPPFELADVNVLLGPTAIEHGAADAPALLERMDRLGIASAVVTHTYSWKRFVAEGNALVLDAVRDRPRLRPCWAVLPDTCGEVPEPAVTVAAAGEAGVAAFRAYPADHGYDLTGPDLAELLAGLEEYGRPLLLDSDQVGWGQVDTLAQRYPGLPIVVTTTGYRTVRSMAGVLSRRPNVHVDLAYLSTHQVLEWLVGRFGASRVLFGTGFPERDPADAVTRLLWSDLDEEEAAAVGAGNLRRLLGDEGPASAGATSTGAKSAGTTSAGAKPSGAAAVRAAGPVADAAGTGADALAALFDRRPLERLRVVDAHAHAGPYSRFFIPDHDVAGMVRVMERCGVSVAFVAAHLALDLDVEGGNAETAAFVDGSGGRLRGLVSVNPHHDPERTLQRWIHDPRFVGAKLHPELQQYPITGHRYDPVWQAATELGFPVLVHSWAGSAYNDLPQFDEVATRYPDACILLGHAGGRRSHFDAVADLALAHPNLVVETCGTPMTGFWVRELVRKVGADRVLFGSDFPFIDQRYALGRSLFAGLTDEELELVAGGAASRLVHRFRPDDDAFAPVVPVAHGVDPSGRDTPVSPPR